MLILNYINCFETLCCHPNNLSKAVSKLDKNKLYILDDRDNLTPLDNIMQAIKISI